MTKFDKVILAIMFFFLIGGFCYMVVENARISFENTVLRNQLNELHGEKFLLEAEQWGE